MGDVSYERRRVHDAVYCVALHRYVVSRVAGGERVTELAACSIVRMARELGMRPAPNLQLHGFRLSHGFVRPLPADDVYDGLQRIDRYGARSLLRRLCARFEDLSVVELERVFVEGCPRTEQPVLPGLNSALWG